MKRIVSLILCLLMALSCVSFASAEDTAAPVMPFRDLDAATITREMGLGWNLGNTFDAHTAFTPDEVLRMDWLCDNVIGSIPQFDEIEPFAHSIVRQLGIYRDQIPAETEGAL